MDITIDADEHWEGYLNTRLGDAGDLLAQISEAIETINPDRREHAADLLDSAIEILTRLRRRLPPGEPAPPAPEPPF